MRETRPLQLGFYGVGFRRAVFFLLVVVVVVVMVAFYSEGLAGTSTRRPRCWIAWSFPRVSVLSLSLFVA